MTALPDSLVVLDHPLVQHKLTRLRQASTSTAGFRRLTRELSLLMCYEATRDLSTEPVEIDTPLERMEGRQLSGKKLCFVSILRAGNGILDGMLDLIPAARVGHVGLYRDHDTLEAVEYYMKLPDDVAERDCIVVDPMLATGHSAAAALDRIKASGVRKIIFVCLLAAPEGVACLAERHPDVRVVTCAVDRGLDEKGYIRPGLGDAGDRLFGTR
ncbi:MULTISPECIES: uracil phosphoribosyltransferase [Asaia]|uniref:Uracil phosphoribosyltransferase n=2 Tax=Asaia TaxID=91914 RepID=A0ABQ1LSY6_9PROT|nr:MULTISPECIES: uracil phosphoribosyltransferase [Asaia]GBR03392.1 uracil phosphoribosyltransferase [Asaia siamensis NRIC 0323]GBR22081.1 uracil phosphoribosyltransferase [Asaia spathodeae NBRC 105894]GGC29299.1 uracil phosphoribosyltransferase [Asaia siamensis]